MIHDNINSDKNKPEHTKNLCEKPLAVLDGRTGLSHILSHKKARRGPAAPRPL